MAAASGFKNGGNNENILDLERQNSRIETRKLTYLLYEGKENVERMEKAEYHFRNDPIFETESLYYLPREEQYRRTLRMAAKTEIIARRNNLNEDQTALLRKAFTRLVHSATPTALHGLMFVGNLALLFTEEQQKKWHQMAKNWRLIGCYIQTELGHGSNVRGLETTATFIPETDEFEIHSPTLSSVKWWPGALSQTANIGVVYARLLIKGKDYGIHNFMVQLRDLETHKSLPGMTLGNIGPKIGFNAVDNGFCRFDKVRIPRDHMAMRVATVDRHGNYRKNEDFPHEVLYISMLQSRVEFVKLTGMGLAMGCTISIRYSAVRKQGYSAQGKSKTEMKVLDYPTQQYRLFPQLAAAYAIAFAGIEMESLGKKLHKQVQNGNMMMLPMVHAISCALKVACSEITCNGIEVCRRACGGHGYLQSSGLPVLLGDIVQTVTAEGENYVIAQQTGRTLLKVLAAFRAGMPLPPPLNYLTKIDRASTRGAHLKSKWLLPNVYIEAFEQTFLFLFRKFEYVTSQASSTAVGIQENSVLCFRLCLAYSRLLLVSGFVAAVEKSAKCDDKKMSLNVETISALWNLCHLFALSQIEADIGEFLESKAVLLEEAEMIRSTVAEILPQIRPAAVKLVDSFNFSDQCLNSTLGRYDGKVYEALYASVQHDMSNQRASGAEDGEVALKELLLPIREEIARQQRSKL